MPHCMPSASIWVQILCGSTRSTTSQRRSRKTTTVAANDHLFLSALQELTAYAAAEAARLKQARESVLTYYPSAQERDAPGSILNEMQKLLATYRALVTSVSERDDGDHT